MDFNTASLLVILVYIISSIIAFISLLAYQFIAQRLAGSALCVSLLLCFLIMLVIIKNLSGENNAQSSRKAAIAGFVAFILLLDIFFLAKSVVMKQSDAAKLFCFGYNTGSTGYFGTIYGIRVVCAIFFAFIVYLLLNNKKKDYDYRATGGIAFLWGILSIVTMILTSLADIPEIASDDSIKYCKSKADSWGLSTEVFDDI